MAKPGSVGDDNGGEKIPLNFPTGPGYYFAPTDVELIDILKKEILGRQAFEIIPFTDVFGTNPDQLPFDRFKYGSGNYWFFYTSKPDYIQFTGDGYWSPIFEDEIRIGYRVIGFMKEFTYYRGMLHQGKRTYWGLYQYRVNPVLYAALSGDPLAKDKILNFVACKIYNKREASSHSKSKKRKK